MRRLTDRRARDDRAGIGLGRLRAADHRDAEIDGGWSLNGSKTFVTNAPDSDLFIVFATTDRSLGFAGLCAFVVERAAPGLEVGAPFSKMGLRTSHLGELFFTDCHVPADGLLGEPGGGMAIFNTSMRWERSLILAAAVGTMRRQLERCIAYARERVQFRSPIGAFQAVSHPLAEMRLRLQTSHLMLYRMAALLDAGTATDLDAAMTKLHLSEALVQSSLDALQIHGGSGYMTESGLERDVRDALGGRIYSGHVGDAAQRDRPPPRTVTVVMFMIFSLRPRGGRAPGSRWWTGTGNCPMPSSMRGRAASPRRWSTAASNREIAWGCCSRSPGGA